MPKPGSVLEGGGLQLVIVGHGPSILSGLGAVIDSCTVIRLKQDLDPRRRKKAFVHWGTRTDYICSRSPPYLHNPAYWHFAGELERRWVAFFESFRPHIDMTPHVPKPSTGMCAVFCAMEFLKPAEISLIGFDAWFGGTDLKWSEERAQRKPHDFATERRVAESLTRITQLESHGEVSGIRRAEGSVSV
jgi:hypothetical protein